MMRRAWVVGCVAALVLSAAVTPRPMVAASRLAGSEVRIGAIVPSSGPFGEWGKTNTIALRLLQDQVNARGGVKGVPLKIILDDDASNPQQSASLVRKLAGDDKVLAIAGPLSSSSCEVAFPVANEMKIVATSQASSKPGVAAKNRPWAFRNTIDEGIFAKATVPYLKTTFHVKSVAIVYDAKDAVSSAIGTKIMPAVIQANGIAVLNKNNPVSFQTSDVDVSAQVTALKGLNPDAVAIGADYSAAVTVIREMKRQGFVRPVVGGSPLISSAILLAAPDVPIVAPATYYVGINALRAAQFSKDLGARFKQASTLAAGTEPNMFDANIYEIVNVYLEAIEKAGVTNRPQDLAADREKIRRYMTNLRFQGLVGSIAFNKDGDAVKRFFVVANKAGKWAPKVEACSAPGGCPK